MTNLKSQVRQEERRPKQWQRKGRQNQLKTKPMQKAYGKHKWKDCHESKDQQVQH